MQVIYYDSYYINSGNNKNPNLIFTIESDVVKWHSDNKYKYFKDNVHILDIDFSKVVNNKINLSKIFDLGIDEGIIHNKIIYDSEIDIYIEHIYNIMKYNAIDKIGITDINVQIECILKKYSDNSISYTYEYSIITDNNGNKISIIDYRLYDKFILIIGMPIIGLF